MSRYKEIEYPRTQVKKAGRLFSSGRGTKEERETALKIINNWRAAHAYPLQVFYVNLRRRAPETAIIAQRLKRLESITAKLSRFPNMSMSTMQDIGGCRIIVDTIDEVYAMVDKIKKSQWKHRFKEAYDYIATPKEDGYRCYHLVYSYRSNKNDKYNGLYIEIQIRTRFQHLWATAVETLDEIDGDSLKIGRGKEESKRFFVLASALLQLYEKSGYSVEAVRTDPIVREMQEFEAQHKIINRLSAVKATEGIVFSAEDGTQGYFLLISNARNQQTEIRFYPQSDIEKATNDYDTKESSRQAYEDVVLVSTTSIETLKKAYPNYFSNIDEFVTLMNQFIK